MLRRFKILDRIYKIAKEVSDVSMLSTIHQMVHNVLMLMFQLSVVLMGLILFMLGVSKCLRLDLWEIELDFPQTFSTHF